MKYKLEYFKGKCFAIKQEEVMKYKLLKDLPWTNAGTIYEKPDKGWYQAGTSSITIPTPYVEDNPDWFEPVDDIMDIFHSWPQGNKYFKWDRDVSFEFAKYYHKQMMEK